MNKRNAIKRDLRTPKYRARVIPDKRRRARRLACREKTTEPMRTFYAVQKLRTDGTWETLKLFYRPTWALASIERNDEDGTFRVEPVEREIYD
jgi:hypothetical protein